MTRSEVESLVSSMGLEYPGNSYNIIDRNCNCFADDLCKRLVGRPVPYYVNRLAYLGSWFSCVLPSWLTNGAGPGSQGSGGRSTSSDVPLQPVGPPAPKFTPFTGEGHAVSITSNMSGASADVSEADMRQRRAEAAARRMGLGGVTSNVSPKTFTDKTFMEVVGAPECGKVRSTGAPSQQRLSRCSAWLRSSLDWAKEQGLRVPLDIDLYEFPTVVSISGRSLVSLGASWCSLGALCNSSNASGLSQRACSTGTLVKN
eukprot:CAMPEP_0114559802 /NCGR_PEP_ID=MMETSP0114-20121206/11113_1 /TAXON_ID=31324 /ORGANISM="Goniomonas sp, Strain m" /LENGTH=257 /DNA_ID=CAMNT_0001745291 /DNA_START=264 /DNA_END=1035 /DNA_ORIENTATION=-